MKIRVKYILANDAMGKYRWWTPEMEDYSQFEHAETLEEIVDKARKLVSVQLEKDN